MRVGLLIGSRQAATKTGSAIGAAAGGGDEDLSGPMPYHQQQMPLKYAKFSNAYNLVYVRQSDWPTIMCEVTKDDIAKHLLDRLEVRRVVGMWHCNLRIWEHCCRIERHCVCAS